MQMTAVDNFLDSILPWVLLEVDHRRRRNVLRTPVTHTAANKVPLVLKWK